MSEPLVSVRALGFSYPGGTPVLRGVSFDVRAGERVALLGANGAGKSTLLQQLNGLLLPAAGSVRIDGIEVREQTLRAVRARVGFVFQDADDQLFLPTVLEDVAFGPLNAGVARAQAHDASVRLLESLGIAAHADRAAHHLSGGEKRLAALATVLVSQPLLLVLDEPTGELDARARQRIVRLLRERAETLLLATHDLEVARAVCERAVVLAAGDVAYDGPIEPLLRDAAHLELLGLAAPLS